MLAVRKPLKTEGNLGRVMCLLIAYCDWCKYSNFIALQQLLVLHGSHASMHSSCARHVRIQLIEFMC